MPIGAHIAVAHAMAGFVRVTVNRLVAGGAYAAAANAAAGSLQDDIGRQALVAIGCGGTDGQTRTNSIDSLAIGNILTLGVGQTSAFGGASGNAILANTKATVADVNLLGGLVTLAGVTAVANDKFQAGVRTSSTAGTQVAALKIAGLSLGAITTPNVRLTVPGVGFLVVNESIIAKPRSNDVTQANGFRLVVTTNNLFGLPVGAAIVVAHAHSAVDGGMTASRRAVAADEFSRDSLSDGF